MAKPRSAAIFDLDRTLIPASSAGALQAHLEAAGLLTNRSGLAAAIFDRAFALAGESGLLVQFGRVGPRSARGWNVARTQEAALAAVDDLEAQVPTFARNLIDEHRAEGRVTVLATAGPAPLVAPFADRLGFDHLVASRWGIDGKVYDGTLDGPMVWGRAKRDAVRHLADLEQIDLRSSYAYSDSYFDAPLLEAVGHPVAANPDPRLAALALVKGWPVRFLDKPEGVIKIAGRELQDLFRPFARPELVPNARIEISGLRHIPETGGAIIVGNHRSYFDPTVMTMLIARAGRNARFLGKKEVFDVPLVGRLAMAAGGIRVDRGTGSDEPLDAAVEALRGGEVVMVMPQGTIPRGPAFFDPELKGRWGAARMAARADVPVIPVGLWGTEHVWPRSSRLPRMRVDAPPVVTATVGPPVPLSHDDPDADTTAIMQAIMALLPDEARQIRTPTPEQLARTYPPGYDGDPERELDRRPGTDT